MVEVNLATFSCCGHYWILDIGLSPLFSYFYAQIVLAYERAMCSLEK